MFVVSTETYFCCFLEGKGRKQLMRVCNYYDISSQHLFLLSIMQMRAHNHYSYVKNYRLHLIILIFGNVNYLQRYNYIKKRKSFAKLCYFNSSSADKIFSTLRPILWRCSISQKKFRGLLLFSMTFATQNSHLF